MYILLLTCCAIYPNRLISCESLSFGDMSWSGVALCLWLRNVLVQQSNWRSESNHIQLWLLMTKMFCKYYAVELLSLNKFFNKRPTGDNLQVTGDFSEAAWSDLTDDAELGDCPSSSLVMKPQVKNFHIWLDVNDWRGTTRDVPGSFWGSFWSLRARWSGAGQRWAGCRPFLPLWRETWR